MYNYRPVGIYSAKTIFDEERDQRLGTGNGNFIIYPRIWNDDFQSYNYSFDWNRDKDELFSLLSVSSKDLLGNCITGKDIFIKEYELIKEKIHDTDYYPPALRMFKNHDQVTGKNVYLSLIIHYTDVKQVAGEKISIDFDSNVFDVGFTTDGKTISSKEFILEKKYFREKGYRINEESHFSIQFYDDSSAKLVVLNNLLIKCKNTHSDDKKINFLNSKGDIVGCIIVKENKNIILSNRSFKYIKLKRKLHIDNDLKVIKERILSSYITDENNNEVKSKDENEFLTKYTKSLVGNYLSRVPISFSTQFSVDELEIDNTYLEQENIISGTEVLQGSAYLKYVQKKYFLEHNISEKEIRDTIFMFISPIDSKPDAALSGRLVAGYVIYEGLYHFSAIIHRFTSDVLLHEIMHELGLAHTFDGKEKLENDIKREQDNLLIYKNNKEIFSQNKKLIEDWKKDLQIRLPSQYPFLYGTESIPNKQKWQEKISNFEAENNSNDLQNEKNIISTELMIRFFEKRAKLHQIVFKQGTTDNVMDYSGMKYGFFNYQYNITKELHEEFNHI
ncbi:hypothetical protein [Chryseobacterium chendengshani]|uniref:hypothetical protein n=1 Tax=Chryseobacterium sp. LJ756 TaxID=2864113 RepID=UPI001C640451|nr:hypothetical protein [Chryseobacterium sp. LJ756]MBW7675496.1 hypothetical protein [Chryseobacterium sp. LJ756]